MNKTLIPLVTNFNSEEWSSCVKFLEMRHSEDAKIISLFQVLKSRKDVEVDLQNIHSSKFSDVSAPGFTKLVSKLFIECEQFLVMNHIMKDQVRSDLVLNEIYNSRGLYHLADRKATKLHKYIDLKKTYSLEDRKLLAELHHQQCYSDNPIKYEKDSTLLRDLINYQMTVLKQRSLMYLCETENWSLITKEEFSAETDMLSKAIELLPKDEISSSLSKVRKVIVDLDVVSFLEVRKELYAGKFEIPSELHTIMTMYLINGCIKLWRKGTYADANENAKLLEYGLSSGALLSSGKFPTIRFLNLLSTLGKLKSYKWNEAFIARWIDSVETNSRDSVFALAKALNAFHFGKYELIHPLVRNVEFENFREKIRALGLEMISLYLDRKDNYGILRNFIANYKRTLKRSKSKISSTSKRAYLNLVKVVELLVQKDFRRLTIKLDKYQPIAYRTWVSEEVGRR